MADLPHAHEESRRIRQCRRRQVDVGAAAGGDHGAAALRRRSHPVSGGRYRPDEKDGGKISHEEYLSIHKEILGRDRWIIDGFESVALAWERFAAADTLVHVDLPILSHYWGVTKRFAAGQFRNPKGWPENSPGLGEHARQLPGRLALPSPIDAEVSPARRRSRRLEAGAPFAVAGADEGISPRCRATARASGVARIERIAKSGAARLPTLPAPSRTKAQLKLPSATAGAAVVSLQQTNSQRRAPWDGIVSSLQRC